MKKFIVLFLLFFSLILSSNNYASDVYYCSDNDLIGFDPKENFKKKNYTEQKFKILIDFENKDVISEDIDMDEFIERKCVFEDFTDTLYCINTVGTAFSINKTTLLFIRSVMFNMADLEDDIGIGYGSCQEF